MAKSRNDTSWIRTYRDSVELLGIWDKRGVLYSSSILPKDERRPWVDSVTVSGDIIDRALFYYLCH